MKKVFKWTGIIIGSLIVIIILILIIVPSFFDINRYKSRIEQEISKAAGRPFTIGGDIKLSLFPLAGFSFSDVRIGNPDGFSEKDFISVKSMDVKVRFLPLLSKDVQVKRFIIDGPRIVLEKTKDGKAGWQGLGKKETPVPAEEAQAKKASGLSVKGLSVAEFSVTGGELIYIDQTSGTRREIQDLNIEVSDASLENPLSLMAAANVEGRPVSIQGKVGPIGREPGKGVMTVDLVVRAMDLLSVKLQGSITDAAVKPQFDLHLTVDNFSPRDLIKALKPDLQLKTKDPAVLAAMSIDMKIKGTQEDIEITDGTIKLDQSVISMSASARDLARPDLSLKITLDKLDADRYMAPDAGDKTEGKTISRPKTDYSPLRKMIIDGAFDAGSLTIKGMQLKDIQARLKGQKGIFNLSPVSLNVYEGNVKASALINFNGDLPVTQSKIEAKSIKVRKLISDFMKKEILEGKAEASADLSMSGDSEGLIKKTLSGNGEIRITDGAIVGIDLSGMINNIKSAFGKTQPGENTGRTEFSEFIIPFDIKDGIIDTQDTSLVSPVLKVKAKGNADLTKETLDFRIEPTLMVKKKEGSGYTVPVLVKGTFTDPKFSPDLSGALEKSLKKGIEKLLKGKTEDNSEKSESTKDGVKGLLKGLFGK